MMNNALFIKNDLYPLLKLAVPLAFIGLVQSSIFFFETLFLAHLGQETLAAGALVSWLFGTFAVILFGILSSINVLIAHQYGAKNHDAITLIVRDGLLLALLLTFPAFLLFWNMAPIFLVLGQDPSIVTLATAYLHALAWGLLPDFIMIAFLEFLIGLGHTRTIMVFTVMSVTLNVGSSYLLIFGKFGLPALGIAGAGWGMTISTWVTVVLLASYVFLNQHYVRYFSSILKWYKPLYLKELLQIGIPMGAMYCIEVAFFFALTLLMGSLESHLLASTQIVMQYLGTLMAIVFSIAQAITVRMGHLLGADQLDAAKRANYTGVCISTIFMTIISLFYWFSPTLLISIDFNVHDPKNAHIISSAKQFFAIGAIFQILEAVRISFFGGLRGLKDTQFTLITSIISFWLIALPLGYLLAVYGDFGGAGLWWGMVAGASVSVIMLYRRFNYKMRRYYKYHQAIVC